MPLFSIAVPAFKINFFEECIQSVLQQTYEDFELIIVNDASPDPLEDIVAKYPDPRIIYKKNDVGYGGYNVVGNWMECLKLAKGKYFMCIGDDDRLLPDCLEKYVALIGQYPEYKLYHAGTQLINEDSQIFNLQEPRPSVESAWSMVWHRWFRRRTTYIGDFLFETDYLKQQGGFIWFPYAWGSDQCTVYKIAACTGGIANMQDYAFQYRCSNKTISNTNSISKVKIDACVQAKAWFKEFLSEPPTDQYDIIYWKVLCNGINDYFDEQYKKLITLDIRANRSVGNILYWIRNAGKYHLSVPSVILCILHGL